MRIALFTETYLPLINGVVTHIKSLKEGLEAKGHTVLIVTASSKVKKPVVIEGILYCPAVITGIYNYDASAPFSTKRFQIIKNWNPDIIHIHNEFGIGMSGIIFAYFLKVPLVYTLHTMYDNYIYYVAKQKHLSKTVASFSHGYARILAASADGLIGPSAKVEEYFRQRGVKKPVSIIANPVELNVFDTDKICNQKILEIKKKYNISENDFVLCFCGRLGNEKNISLIFEYLSETLLKDKNAKNHPKQIKFMVIGDGPLYEQLVKEREDFDLSETVIFAGKVEHDEIAPYYCACNAYITASLTDTHSISMLEAMAVGLPVLHIYDEINGGQIVDGINGYIYKDKDEMYQKILMLSNMEKEEYAAFNKRVKESVAGFGAENLASNVLQVYDAVILKYNKEKKNRKYHKFFARKKSKESSSRKESSTPSSHRLKRTKEHLRFILRGPHLSTQKTPLHTEDFDTLSETKEDSNERKQNQNKPKQG